MPVVNVSWHDANGYVPWLSKATGRTYRLPTEAEREYVTRAATTSHFSWGPNIRPAQANYNHRFNDRYGGESGDPRNEPYRSTVTGQMWGLKIFMATFGSGRGAVGHRH